MKDTVRDLIMSADKENLKLVAMIAQEKPSYRHEVYQVMNELNEKSRFSPYYEMFDCIRKVWDKKCADYYSQPDHYHTIDALHYWAYGKDREGTNANM